MKTDAVESRIRVLREWRKRCMCCEVDGDQVDVWAVNMTRYVP
jgi:hypothetical protein